MQAVDCDILNILAIDYMQCNRCDLHSDWFELFHHKMLLMVNSKCIKE